SVIVINSLDECIDPMVQVSILQIIAKAVCYDAFLLGFFITSRPEHHLQDVFDTKELIFATKLIYWTVFQGFHRTFKLGFTRILNDHKFRMALRSVPRPWPSPEKIKELVNRSSGQFIYAATVMRFISGPDHNPNAQLEIVLGIKKSEKTSPLEDLDILYTEILSRAQDTERTMKVLAYILAIRKVSHKDCNKSLPMAIGKAATLNQQRLLLVIEQLLYLSPGEAYFSLNQLHSLILIEVGSESFRRNLKIEFHHTVPIKSIAHTKYKQTRLRET
ncbi:hypothetical protein BDQ17DRAFT_1244625, partial [Cyathus striatus]